MQKIERCNHSTISKAECWRILTNNCNHVRRSHTIVQTCYSLNQSNLYQCPFILIEIESSKEQKNKIQFHNSSYWVADIWLRWYIFSLYSFFLCFSYEFFYSNRMRILIKWTMSILQITRKSIEVVEKTRRIFFFLYLYHLI